MTEKQKKSLSKFISFVLRHKPEFIGLSLDNNGWADVEELISKSSTANHNFTREWLEEIVADNDKQRFIFNDDKSKIRANQGHSIAVELNLKATTPPDILYHGTGTELYELIFAEGIKKMDRQHVHLSADIDTAKKVGSRKGKPRVIRIDSGQMHRDGLEFFISANGVWLTHEVPARYFLHDAPDG